MDYRYIACLIGLAVLYLFLVVLHLFPEIIDWIGSFRRKRLRTDDPVIVEEPEEREQHTEDLSEQPLEDPRLRLDRTRLLRALSYSDSAYHLVKIIQSTMCEHMTRPACIDCAKAQVGRLEELCRLGYIYSSNTHDYQLTPWGRERLCQGGNSAFLASLAEAMDKQIENVHSKAISAKGFVPSPTPPKVVPKKPRPSFLKLVK